MLLKLIIPAIQNINGGDIFLSLKTNVQTSASWWPTRPRSICITLEKHQSVPSVEYVVKMIYPDVCTSLDDFVVVCIYSHFKCLQNLNNVRNTICYHTILHLNSFHHNLNFEFWYR